MIYNVPSMRYHYPHTLTGFFFLIFTLTTRESCLPIHYPMNIFYWKHKLCKFVGNTFYCFTKTSYSQTLRVIVPWINSPTFYHSWELFKNNARVMLTSSRQINKVVFWRLVSLNQAKNNLFKESVEAKHQRAPSIYFLCWQRNDDNVNTVRQIF